MTCQNCQTSAEQAFGSEFEIAGSQAANDASDEEYREHAYYCVRAGADGRLPYCE